MSVLYNMNKRGSCFLYGIKLNLDHPLYKMNGFVEQTFNITESDSCPNMRIIEVDSEHKSFDSPYGGESFLIGLIVSDMTYTYNGCSVVPSVSENQVKCIQQFLNENPKLGHLKPQLYVFCNSDD
jgi:hypothetical protein